MKRVEESRREHEAERADGERFLPYWVVGAGVTPFGARLAGFAVGLAAGLLVFVGLDVLTGPGTAPVVATTAVLGRLVADGWYSFGARRIKAAAGGEPADT